MMPQFYSAFVSFSGFINTEVSRSSREVCRSGGRIGFSIRRGKSQLTAVSQSQNGDTKNKNRPEIREIIFLFFLLRFWFWFVNAGSYISNALKPTPQKIGFAVWRQPNREAYFLWCCLDFALGRLRTPRVCGVRLG